MSERNIVDDGDEFEQMRHTAANSQIIVKKANYVSQLSSAAKPTVASGRSIEPP